MNEVLLGIDIGTSACKVVAFTPEGKVVSQANGPYNVYYPKKGWAEQSPDEWWAAVCKAIKEVLQKGKINNKDIKGIGIDGQSWSAIAIDKNGKVLCNTPIWMDTRSKSICDDILKENDADELFSVCGNPMQPMYTLPKILWYKKNLPSVYKSADKILQSNSFIAYKLSGAVSQEPSQGYGYTCYNMQKNCWDYKLCEKLGIRKDLLPPIVACHSVVGKVTKKAAEETSLMEGTPVVAGGLDAACGTLGTGVIHKGQTQEQGGQAGGMSICLDKPMADKSLILGAHVVPELWLLQGGTVGGGGVVNWFEKEFCAEERELAAMNSTNSFMEMDKGADKVTPGSDGLVFLPYMSGERSPIWDPNAKGVYFGIDFSKTRSHFARASMEGVAYSLLHNLEVAKKAGADVETLSSMGGAANSKLWMQIKADITGKHIVVPSSDTATALGAAILAGVGTGVYDSFENAVERTVKIKKEFYPNPKNKEVYKKGYKTYLALYSNLRNLMKEV